jgi:flagellar basal-body rod protein FlgF/flagellar basal-body rod protein FlgG
MENALLIGLSRQVALTRELEAVANNIANVNTTGFKADSTVFEEFLMPVARDNQFSAADRRVSFVRDRATWHDLGQGPVQKTGNPLDVVINGNAFFAVQTPRGERYTRNGAFQINSTGELVTSEGDRVLGEAGPIQFQSTDNNVSIGSDGTIRVREGSNATIDAARGKLRLVSFDQPHRLQKDGGTRFLAPAGIAPQPAVRVSVTQGAIEKSNVRAVVEMTRMIEITRAYTHIGMLLQQQSEMRRSTIEKLATVPA